MEELEPWNMFTNDYVSEESEANDCLNNGSGQAGENEKDNGECDGNGDNDDDAEDDDTSFLVPEVTMGDDDAEDQSNGNDEDEPGEDDDAIFNFGLEPKSSPSERPKRSPQTSKEVARSKKELEALINYDQAVVYICPACGSEFDTQELWKRHMNGVHAFNTRRGLNFLQIDKLYHECMECFKRIAMHSMENLLKHKYTHLPYRCSKCKFCQRQYKYRQDLMVHLRTQHYDELIESAQLAKEVLDKQQDDSQNSQGLAIRDIKENAVDIFENTFVDDEPVSVRNELMDQGDDVDASVDQSRNSFLLPAFLEDSLSRDSSRNSDQQSNGSGGAPVEEQVVYEKQIQYICPKCGQEYGTHNQWQQHIVSVHDYGTRRGLNFEEINSNQQARCLECDKVIPVNIIHHLQQHKFTHLPHKSWLRCKLCFQAFLSRSYILKHLMNQHRLGSDSNNIRGGSDSMNQTGNENDDADDSQDIWDCDDSLLTEDQRAPSKKKKNEERDKFDQHIEYLCPTCGNEFREKKLWRKHIGSIHKLTSLEALNFKNVNEREVMCLECGKVITNAYGIQNAQQHYFTHMPFKSFIRCRLCSKSYTDRKGLVKHLRGKHFGRIKIYEPPVSSSLQKPYGGVFASAPLLPTTNRQVVQPQSNQLLSRALQRPLRNAENSATASSSKRQRQERYKEIVTRNNVVYEIEFLDENDDECDTEVGIVNAAEDDDDVLLVPEISAINNGNRFSGLNNRERCADCGSIFSTPEALRAHIRKEHDFYERPKANVDQYGHLTPNESFVDDADEHSNEDTLLMPTAVEKPNYSPSSKPSTGTPTADCHFTYLCPACGVEHYTQMDWRRHINGVHNFDKRHYLNFRQLGQDRFQCTICNDIVTKSKLKTLQDHKFRHLPYKSYLKCKYCGTLYNHKPNMFGHLQVRHNIYITRNAGNEDVGGDGKASPAATHLQRASNSNILSRSQNIRSYGSASQKYNSGGANSSSFAKPPGLKTVEDVITFHNAVDHATITYFCPSCNENFDSHVFWRKHIVEEHNLNSREGLNFRQIDEHHYLCLQCYKRVTVTHTKGAIGQLQSHKFRHLPYKSFKCLKCNGEFVRKQMFFKHLNRATNRCQGTNIVENTKITIERNLPLKERVQETKSTIVSNSKNGEDSLGEQNFLFDETLDPLETQDDGTNASLILNQDAFVLVCPQCAAQFDSQRNWREHINVEHDLGKRENLGFKRISPMLHKCLECGEHVSGRKLRDLQIHRFKHMPYGPYIQCKFCKTGYSHIRNMQDHLRQKHPNVVQKHEEYAKMEEMRLYEENSLTDADSIGGSSVVNEADVEDDDVQVVIGDVEEDEQYLLG